jgi:hypothetical protein
LAYSISSIVPCGDGHRQRRSKDDLETRAHSSWRGTKCPS